MPYANYSVSKSAQAQERLGLIETKWGLLWITNFKRQTIQISLFYDLIMRLFGEFLKLSYMSGFGLYAHVSERVQIHVFRIYRIKIRCNLF